MEDIDKREFCSNIYNQLIDEFNMVDPEGEVAGKIQSATGKDLDNILRFLQSELLRNMELKIKNMMGLH